MPIRHVLDRALSTDREVSRAAMKELNSRRYRHSQAELNQVFELLPISREIQDDPRRFEVFLRIMGFAWHAKASTLRRNELLDLVWLGVTHQNGMVRQAARRLLDAVRMSWSFTDSETSRQYVILLEHIEALLKTHAPLHYPSSMEAAQPSVFKTLTLMWYDITDIPLVQQAIDVEQRMIDHGIVPYLEPYDEDSELGAYQLEDWQKHLEMYAACQNPKKTTAQLSLLQAAAERQLKWALKKLDKLSLYKKIIYHAQFGENDALTKVITMTTQSELASARSESEAMLTMFRLSKLARAVQLMSNNYAQKSRAGTPFSRTVLNAVFYEQDKMKPEKVVVDDVVSALIETRKCIDRLETAIIKQTKQTVAEWKQLYEKSDIPFDKSYECSADDITEMTYILQFMVDKLAMDYKRLIRTRPEKIVAGITRLFAQQHPWLPLAGVTAEELALFGGWKNISSLSSVANDYHYRMSQFVQDPSILLLIRSHEDINFSQEIMTR